MLVELNCQPGDANFAASRMECLAAVHGKLCAPPPVGAGAGAGAGAIAALASSGWEQQSSRTMFYLRLWHPQLRLQLDVQVRRREGHARLAARRDAAWPLASKVLLPSRFKRALPAPPRLSAPRARRCARRSAAARARPACARTWRP